MLKITCKPPRRKGRVRSCLGCKQGSPSSHRAGSQPCTQPSVAGTLLTASARTQRGTMALSAKGSGPEKGPKAPWGHSTPQKPRGWSRRSSTEVHPKGFPLCHPGKPLLLRPPVLPAAKNRNRWVPPTLSSPGGSFFPPHNTFLGWFIYNYHCQDSDTSYSYDFFNIHFKSLI